MGLFSQGATLCSIVEGIVSIINLMVGVLAVLAIVVFFIGLVRFIRDAGDTHGHNEGKERIVWSLIALFVLFSIWGILALMSTAFFGGPTPGTSSCSGATSSSLNSGANNASGANNSANGSASGSYTPGTSANSIY